MSLESKKQWTWPKEKLEIKTLLEYVLKSREISDEEEFLSPSLDQLPDFKKLFGSVAGAKMIVKSIKAGKKIVIHGDYDSDGICATALLWEFLYKELAQHLDKKVDVVPYIPSRVDQGYGLTESSLNDCIELGADLIITVDCGIRDKELIERYINEKNLSFVITDHHQPQEGFVDDLTYPIIHQRYPKHPYADVEVCGAFVAFILVQSIKAQVGMESEITDSTKGLDLVALATVTDIMELKSINRVVVKYGLEQIKKSDRKGLIALIGKAQVELSDIDAYHLGFVIGPRINASGRIDSAMDAVRLLVSNDSILCLELSSKLDYLNYQRQKMTSEAISEAKELVNDKNNSICILGKDWHEGIVGLIAGKLNEEFNKPVLIATDINEEIKGSGRSIKGFNITNALESCSKYLERFGGHEMACGFTVKKGKWEDFKKAFEKIADSEITKDMLLPKLDIDLFLSSNDISLELVNLLKRLEPFGYGNRKPLIGLKSVIVVKKQIMGKTQNHMKLLCKGDGVDLITIVMFRCDEDIEKIKINDSLDVVGNISVNSWNGNEDIQMIAKEWKYSV